MADNTVKTIFTAEATSAKIGANEAAVAVEKSAERQEKAVGGLAKTAAILRETFTKILIPAAIAKGIVRIAEAWLQVQKESRAAQEQIDRTRQSLVAIAKQDVFGVREGGELEEAQKKVTAEIRKSAESQSEAIKKRQEELALMSEAQKAQFRTVNGRGTTEEIQRLEDERTRIFTESARAQQQARDRLEKDYAELQRRRAEKEAEEQAKKSRERAKSIEDEAAKINREGLDERAAAVDEFSDKARESLGSINESQSKEEQDALRRLYEAQWQALQRRLTEIQEEENKKRRDDNAATVRAMIAEYEALAGAIDSASQAQQSFSQNQFGGMVSDIKKIAQLLEVRGGWKK